MKIDILTIFPNMFDEILDESIIGRAREAGLISTVVHDIRQFSSDKHRRTDDAPFGGGAGMVMTPQPVFDAIESIDAEKSRLLYMSPRGRLLDADLLTELQKEDRITILCGHYEGVDERILGRFDFEEVSIGDYILTGGELPAMVLIDALTRLLPGALGNEETHDEESIYSGLLEYPQYTRPAVYKDKKAGDMPVPEVLTSGHHREIHLYQFRKSLELTAERRPDLFCAYIESIPQLDKGEQEILCSVIKIYDVDK